MKGYTILLIIMAVACFAVGCFFIGIANNMIGWVMWVNFGYGLLCILCSLFLGTILLRERGK